MLPVIETRINVRRVKSPKWHHKVYHDDAVYNFDNSCYKHVPGRYKRIYLKYLHLCKKVLEITSILKLLLRKYKSPTGLIKISRCKTATKTNKRGQEVEVVSISGQYLKRRQRKDWKTEVWRTDWRTDWRTASKLRVPRQADRGQKMRVLRDVRNSKPGNHDKFRLVSAKTHTSLKWDGTRKCFLLSFTTPYANVTWT